MFACLSFLVSVAGVLALDDPFTGMSPGGTRSAAMCEAGRRAFGELIAFVDEPGLRDLLIQVRANEGQLWLDRGEGLHRVTGWQASPDRVRSLAVSLIAAGGRAIDELHPCAQVRLGDGVRVHAVLPPVAVHGAAISVRLPGAAPPDFTQMVNYGIAPKHLAQQLRRLVQARRNMLITGATGSGKTTLLAALLGLVNPCERIITIEDVAELRITHPGVLSLESRTPNSEGAGSVTLETLVREALRMRPDRIVLGECRGPEIATLMQALNTGHDGGAGTLHANGLEEVPARLEALGALAGLPMNALARQAQTAFHAIIHVSRVPTGHTITGIGALHLGKRGNLEISAVWKNHISHETTEQF